MKVKKLKIALIDDSDNILKSSNPFEIKWTDELKEDMMRHHNINAEELIIDMVFSNIIDAVDQIGLIEEGWKELRSI